MRLHCFSDGVDVSQVLPEDERLTFSCSADSRRREHAIPFGPGKSIRGLSRAYIGAFGRESTFEVKVEADEVLLRIVRTGSERREIAVHLHYYLLADFLKQLGQGLTDHASLDETHLSRLREGVEALIRALRDTAPAAAGEK